MTAGNPPLVLTDRPSLIALIVIPVVMGALLALPNSRRRWSSSDRRLHFAISLAFLIYVSAVAAIILWPFPVLFNGFCEPHRLNAEARLRPLRFVIHSYQEATAGYPISAVAVSGEAIANCLLFVPFGLFLRAMFRMRVRSVILASFAFSLMLELTQLTGVWGAYPCPYRQFDIDDLITNTMGGVIACALVALWIRLPIRSESSFALRGDRL
jgi:glycopeptide antibiotics resistance protein